ncbi:MAG TPA: HutD family protein [Janthinobacterium sp.]|jgi:hypothetical protein|nr:HutD family protein [Janthinobacterium sp.]
MARLIAFKDLPAAPWKNGGGSTTEIMAAPAGAGFDDFDWRVSLATIARSGAFSAFPGIDRSLALVGGGVVLELDGARVELGAAAPPLRFAGETPVFATVEAASTDFNVMTRRGRCRHRLRRLALPASLARRSGTTLLFLADGEQAVAADGAAEFRLRRFDALLLDGGDAVEWDIAAAPGTSIFVVDFFTDAAGAAVVN